MATRRKKAEYHHGHLRQALIDATLALAREKGARAVTLSDAAKHAGVSVAAPYRHFADKDALLAAAAEESFTIFTGRLADANHTGKTAVTRLENHSLAYLRFFAEFPERIELMFGIGLKIWEYPGLLQAALAAFNELGNAVRGLADEGIIPADTTERRTHLFWYLMHGTATLGIARAGPPNAPDPTVAMLELIRAVIPGFELASGKRKKLT